MLFSFSILCHTPIRLTMRKCDLIKIVHCGGRLSPDRSYVSCCSVCNLVIQTRTRVCGYKYIFCMLNLCENLNEVLMATQIIQPILKYVFAIVINSKLLVCVFISIIKENNVLSTTYSLLIFFGARLILVTITLCSNILFYYHYSRRVARHYGLSNWYCFEKQN